MYMGAKGLKSSSNAWITSILPRVSHLHSLSQVFLYARIYSKKWTVRCFCCTNKKLRDKVLVGDIILGDIVIDQNDLM